jgi:hypothetical protein
VVEHKNTGDSGMKNTGKNSDAGSRSSGHNSGESAYGGSSNKASGRDRTKSGHERSSDSTGSKKQSAREPSPCLNTKKCAGEKHYLSDCRHTGKNEAMVLLSEYKKKRDADKKKENFKTLVNNRATSDNRDGQTAYLTAENLGVKVTFRQTQALTTPLYRAVLWRTQESLASLSKSRCCRSPSC